jgi:4-amino-4-deoxy-L-arabinose transferase-like glycosyltransferase
MDTRGSLVRHSWLAVVILVGLAVLKVFQGRLGFYGDEGMNLIKAQLAADGQRLYQEIYSDQAPLMTWLLAAPIRLFDANYQFVRQVAILFGLLALAGASAIAAEVAGRAAGLLCALVLLCLAPFLKFGSTVVITMPALALATWSLLLAFRCGENPSRGVLVASGGLLGVAAGFKLAALYFLPIVVLALLTLAWRTPRSRRPSRMLGWWALGLAIPLALIALVCPLEDMLPQVIRPHVAALAPYAQQAAGMRRVMLLAPGMVFLYLTAAVALVMLLRWRRRSALVLAGWLLVVGGWLLNHRPIWAHHLPDLLLPLAVVSATGVVLGVRHIRSGNWRSLALAALPAALGLTLVVQLTNFGYWRRFYDNTGERDLRTVARALAEATRPGEQVFVDNPIVAFWARRSPPAPLALIVSKRVVSGELTDQRLIEGLDRHRPAGIALCTPLLWRFSGFQQKLARDYAEVTRVLTPLEFSGRQGKQCRVLRRRFADGSASPLPPDRPAQVDRPRPALTPPPARG